MKYLFLILAVYAGIFSVLVIRNHQLYQAFGWDLGFFDQLLWQANRGNLNFVSTIGNINILGDHFQPIIYLLAPLYWLWDDVRIILIVQVLLVTAAAVPLFFLAKEKTKSEFVGLAVSVAYLLFSGTQFTITNEFHQSAFIPLLLSWGLFWMETGKTSYGLAALFSLLLVREEMGLLIVALGIMYLRRKAGPLLIIGGVVVFFLLIKVVIPAVSSQGRYIHYGYGNFGNTPEEVLVSAVKNPRAMAASLISPPVKLGQVIQSITAFGGLPVLNPVSLIPVVEQYAVRFLDDRNIHRWINNNHYSAPLGPLLAVGTIEAISKWVRVFRSSSRFSRYLPFLSIFLLLMSISTAVATHTPILSIFKSQLYFTPEWVKDADKLAAAVPTEGAVAANNSLAPHLTHRDMIYLLPEIRDAEYITVDLTEGPNKHAPWSAEKMREYIDELLKSGDWELKEKFGDAMLLKKI